MKLSTKGRYAMVALADIALQPADRLVNLGDIATRQSISLPYLEQLFVKLRRAELVSSVRGPGGGYRLGRPASDIRVVDIPSWTRRMRNEGRCPSHSLGFRTIWKLM